MREKIALTASSLVLFISLWQFWLVNTGNGLALAAVSVFVGLAIANYDVIKKFKFGKMEIEIAKKEIEDTKQKAIEQLEAKAARAEEKIEKLNEVSNDLTLTYAKIAFLQSATKNQFGTAAATVTLKEIEREINRLLPKALPDKVDRQNWIDQIQSIVAKK